MTPSSAANSTSDAADSQAPSIAADDRRQPPLLGAATRRQTPKYLTTLEFGRAVGKSERSIQRYCKEEKIHAIATEKGFRIAESEVERFLDAEANPVPLQAKGSWPTPADVRRQAPPPEDDMRRLATEGDDEAPSDDVYRQRPSDTQQPPLFNPAEFVPVDVHLAVFDRLSETETELRRSEQQRMALAYTLQQHQKVLAENAESLIEREARTRQAEAQAEAMAESNRAAAELAEEEARQRIAALAALEAANTEAKSAAEVANWRAQELETELAAERQRRQMAEAKAEELAKRSFWKKLFG